MQFLFLQYPVLHNAKFCLFFSLSHIMREMFFLHIYSACHLKVTSYFKILHRVLALRRICRYWWEDISIVAGTLHLLERKYPLLRWKIPYVYSINLKCCDISYHCSTRMSLLGNAQNILMNMFIHQENLFFPPVKWQNYSWSNITNP